MIKPPIAVNVSPELLAALSEWSEPVQVRVELGPDGFYLMTFRHPESGYDYEADIQRGSAIRRPGERPSEAAERMRKERLETVTPPDSEQSE